MSELAPGVRRWGFVIAACAVAATITALWSTGSLHFAAKLADSSEPILQSTNPTDSTARQELHEQNLLARNDGSTLEFRAGFKLSPSANKQALSASMIEGGVTENQLNAMQLTEAWDALRTGPPNESLLESACFMMECRVHAEDLYQDKFTNDPTSAGLSIDHMAYVGAVCTPLVDKLGIEKDVWREVTKQCTGPSAAKVISGWQGLMEHVEMGDVSDSELLEILKSQDHRLAVKAAVIDRALEDERVLTGLAWDELRGELFEPDRSNLTALIAAKLYCTEPAACRPRSLLLFKICTSNLKLDCKINSDLTQIARDSLTPREFRWWENAKLPSEKD